MIPWNMGAYNRKCLEFCKTAGIYRNSHSQAETLLSGNSGQIEQYYIGTGNEIYTGILRQSMPTFIASVFILLAGFFITCYWVFIHNSSHIDGTLFLSGDILHIAWTLGHQ